MTFRILLLFMAFSVAAFSQVPPVDPGVSQELAKWRAAHYSDVRYKLNLTLEKMSPVLKGSIEIRVTVSEPGAIATGLPTPVILDWRKIKGSESLSTISNVSVNGEAKNPVAIAPGSDPEHLVFREGVVTGENVIKLDFTSPILPSGSAITRYVDKDDGSEYLYSLFVPSDASTAFPVFDQPDIKGRFDLHITAPNDWKLVSNTAGSCFRVTAGVEPPQEKPLCPFEETKPISTYVFAFAAGPFERVENPASRSVPPAVAGGLSRPIETSGTPSNSTDVSQEGRFTPALDPSQDSGGKPAFRTEIGSGDAGKVGGSNNSIQPPATAGGTDIGGAVYVRKSQAAKFKPHAAEVFRLNREAIKYFEQYFDYKFPFPKYDLVLIPEFPFGGMEHAGATFLREASIIFPQEPTKNDHISRATLIFHEAAHQWFGDMVTMRWFDDLWLKEGFATFMGYKALEKIMPSAHAWKVFYERVKQAAYQTDSTKGTTPIYQEIKNLSAAKSAYGNIVYNKAPAFLRQAEFYLDEDKFQAAVRTFLKKHEFGNAGWEDLVKEFEGASNKDLREWANNWVTKRGLPIVSKQSVKGWDEMHGCCFYSFYQRNLLGDDSRWRQKTKLLQIVVNSQSGTEESERTYGLESIGPLTSIISAVDGSSAPFFGESTKGWAGTGKSPFFGLPPNGSHFIYIPNYQDYGYGIFLLDEKSRGYVLKNIQNGKDPFLRSMMWGALWDSVREGELDPREYVELVVRVLSKSDAFTRSPVGTAKAATLTETPKGVTLTDDESTTALLLNRVGMAMNYYLSEPPAVAGGSVRWTDPKGNVQPAATASGSDLPERVEALLINGMRNSPTLGQRITYYRAFLNIASSERARGVLKGILRGQLTTPAAKPATPPSKGGELRGSSIPIRTKDKFDIVTRLLILNDPDAAKLLADLEKTETGDDAKRYAYAAKAGIASGENKAKYWNDFVNNKEISESWIEAAFRPWNSIRHSDLTLPYLQKALQELPNHKRSRKIFFVNGWLGAFIGGQRSEEALAVVNKFLVENPNLDNDLRLKILENVDVIERAVRIRGKFPK